MHGRVALLGEPVADAVADGGVRAVEEALQLGGCGGGRGGHGCSYPNRGRSAPCPRSRATATTTTRREAAERRRAFLAEQTGAELEHVGSYSFDPALVQGNVEHFTGVAQVPIGVAGPLLVDGEHAQGEFYVPLATAEGTLVASYNRGMKLLREAGGVKTTILDDRMQRAPAFLFESAREARDFGDWLGEHFDEIAEAAQATTKSGQLIEIEQYSASRDALHALRLHDRRRGGPEPDRQGDGGRLRVDRRQLRAGDRALLPRVELRHRQEELAGQHAAHARQARGGGGDDPERAVPERDALEHARSCTARARSPTSAASCRASTTTAPTRPTASPRCSSPPARTPPTSRSPAPRSSTPSCARTATTTTPSRSRR